MCSDQSHLQDKMLTTTPEYFSTDDIAAIKNWLSQPGAALFRKALQNEASEKQIEASLHAIKGIDPDKKRFNSDAEQSLSRVRDLNMVLKELERAASSEFKPFVTKVVTV